MQEVQAQIDEFESVTQLYGEHTPLDVFESAAHKANLDYLDSKRGAKPLKLFTTIAISVFRITRKFTSSGATPLLFISPVKRSNLKC
jgi:hypothetical protein